MPQPAPKTKPFRPANCAWLVLAAIIVAGVAWWVISSRALLPNYAEEAAKPVEQALQRSGGQKQCSHGGNGLGADNREPSYMATYQLPGNQDQAEAQLVAAATEGGFDLASDPGSVQNSSDTKVLVDRVGKPSSFADLEPGKVTLLTTVYVGRISDGNPALNCTVKKVDNPPADKTTVHFTVGVPRLKD